MEIKLLPCPFCGGEATLIEHHKPYAGYIGCKKCQIFRGFDDVQHKNESVWMWNRRVME